MVSVDLRLFVDLIDGAIERPAIVHMARVASLRS